MEKPRTHKRSKMWAVYTGFYFYILFLCILRHGIWHVKSYSNNVFITSTFIKNVGEKELWFSSMRVVLMAGIMCLISGDKLYNICPAKRHWYPRWNDKWEHYWTAWLIRPEFLSTVIVGTLRICPIVF